MPINYTPQTGRHLYKNILKPAYNKNKGGRRASFGKSDIMAQAKEFLCSEDLAETPIFIQDKAFFDLIQIFVPHIAGTIDESRASVKGLNAVLKHYKIDFNLIIKPLIENHLLTEENWTLLYEAGENFSGIQNEKILGLIGLHRREGAAPTLEEKRAALAATCEKERVLIEANQLAARAGSSAVIVQQLKVSIPKDTPKVDYESSDDGMDDKPTTGAKADSREPDIFDEFAQLQEMEPEKMIACLSRWVSNDGPAAANTDSDEHDDERKATASPSVMR